MRPLSRDYCRALSSAIGTIYGIAGVAEFPAVALSAVARLLRCNTICYNEVFPPDSMTRWVTEPANSLPVPLLQEAFMRNFAEHPVLAHYARTGDGTSYRISDFLSRRQFHDLALYSEYYKPSSVEYQLVAAISIGLRQIGVALDRDAVDFSEDERLSLELLRPHLVQGYRNVHTMELMRRTIEDNKRNLLFVSRSGRTTSVGDAVWRLIDKYFEIPRFRDSLPDTLSRWITHETSRLGEDGDVPSPPAPLVISTGNQKLMIRLLWGGKAADQDALLLEEKENAPAFTLAGADLTSRETEILAWLSQGKTNAEIGLALSISPLTVKKHLEHIYAKWRIHRRSVAVARSLRP